MDAVITNLGTTDLYLPGPAVNLAAGAAMTWEEVTLTAIDEALWLKQMVLDGKVSVSLSAGAIDAAGVAAAGQGALSPHALPRYAFAALPTGYEGRLAYVTNGRKTGEGGGAGTGVPVYFADGSWRVFSTDAAVTI